MNSASAAMVSNNYIIYESVMHTFDGPVISGVSSSVSGTEITVTWTTDVISDSFVIYDTANTFSTSKEQGSSSKTETSHAVILTGLEANTTYYYRVRSERVNGGITTDTTERTFTTGSDTPTTPAPTPSSGGGGGVLIIDKTDKVPPVISNISIADITDMSARISWETDEDATSFVEYGPTADYGHMYGQWGTTTLHTVVLENLKPATDYHFRAVSSDNWGNVGYSDDQTFTTLSGIEEVTEELPPDTTQEIPPGMVDVVGQQAIDFINRLFPNISITDLPGITNLADLIGQTTSPIISTEPRLDVSSTEATVRWSTDIEANSLVALSPDDAYQAGASEPYRQIIGNPEIYTVAHEVTLYGLTPDTSYHFQLRSQAPYGPLSRSADYTFRTSIEELQITSYFTQILDNETAVFKWVTNKPADSAVQFAPYFDGKLAVDQSKTVKDNALSVVHEITIPDFVGGTYYDVEIVSVDEKGNVASKIFPEFSTTEDDLPPQISHIKADSTIFIDQGDKIQTIISWLTNEPSTSRLYFQEGVHSADSQLTESTNLNTNYTKEHVIVITKFKPGVVYSFRVESIDSGGNSTESPLHTFMTAKKKDSIIQVILNILENTFGWMNKLL